MDKKQKNMLPLEFQNLTEVKKQPKNIKKININEKVIYVSVDFYQSKNVMPENFYKPISKIISFDF